jgi:SAM-dependent methyltransferase
MISTVPTVPVTKIRQWRQLQATAELFLAHVNQHHGHLSYSVTQKTPGIAMITALMAHLGITPSNNPGEIANQLKTNLEAKQIKNVLDVGCGSWPLSPLFKGCPSLHFYGMDLQSASSLFWSDLLRQDKEILENIIFRQGDIARLEETFPGLRFDLIFAVGVLSAGSTSRSALAMRYLDRLAYKTSLLQKTINALSNNPWAATLACSVTSVLEVLPQQLIGTKELLWEDAPREESALCLTNWHDWGIRTPPAQPG